jgi:hypothetical protein
MKVQIVELLKNETDEIADFKIKFQWVELIAYSSVLVCLPVTFIGISHIDHSSAYELVRRIVGLISVTVVEVWNVYLMGQISDLITEVINEFLVIL